VLICDNDKEISNIKNQISNTYATLIRDRRDKRDIDEQDK